MTVFKKLDACANLKDLEARRGRPTIAERRRKKIVRRANLPVLSLRRSPLMANKSIAALGGTCYPRCRRSATTGAESASTSASSDEPSSSASFKTAQLARELQAFLESDAPPGCEVDGLDFQQDVNPDRRHIVLRLLDREFPGRSDYAGHFLGRGRSIHWLLRRLTEHCLGGDEVETALRVATVVAVITDESNRNIALHKATQPAADVGEADEVTYKLNHMQHQLDVFVRALDRRMAAGRHDAAAPQEPA